MEPVGAPALKLGDDARAKLARTRDALKEADRRLDGSHEWYEKVREDYSMGR